VGRNATVRRSFFELAVRALRVRAFRGWWHAFRATGAAAFNIKKDGILRGRYWGTHLDLRFLHFNVCYCHGVGQALAEGCRFFNPGAGGEHEKVRGLVPTITHSAHHIEHERFRQIVGLFLERERRGVDQDVAGERAALAK